VLAHDAENTTDEKADIYTQLSITCLPHKSSRLHKENHRKESAHEK